MATTDNTTMNNAENASTKTMGKYLIMAGLLGFASSIVASCFMDVAQLNNGTIPAVAFFFTMLGFCFYFPTMLEDNSGGLSTMRVIAFMVVTVFSIVTLKIGWATQSFELFTIDKTWIYILGLAFGSKAFQKFAEEDPTPPTTTPQADAASPTPQ